MTNPTTAIVREKLGKIWWLCDDAGELTDEIVAIKILVHEVMALMESEQGEQMRKDHRALNVLRAHGFLWSLYGEGIDGENISLGGFPNVVDDAFHFSDSADAILGTESENGADDE